MKKYIGLTIGPICKTLSNAKKTRELWAGSYLFSHIMKSLIDKLEDRTFIIPYVGDKINEIKGRGIGVFPDRFIFKAQDGDFERLDKAVDEVLQDSAAKIAGDLIKNSENGDDIYDDVAEYVKQYFQLYFCEVEYDENEHDKSINENINTHLDVLELQQKFVRKEPRNYIAEFLFKVNKKSFLMKDGFGENFQRFPSLAEIALTDLKLKETNGDLYKKVFEEFDKREDEKGYDIYKELKKKEVREEFKLEKDAIKQYHKYIAIVHADGDNMGAAIKSLTGNFKDFSGKLFEFSLGSNELIEEYGGVTVFAGGDDLLFFAPVVNGTRTIFDLTNDIDCEFNKAFEGFKAKPTLSFGVSMSYHKFPLYEALEMSRKLLNEKAKKGKKNSVAFRVVKHSGQYFEAAYEKNTPEYRCLMKLLALDDRDGGQEQSLLFTSMMHNLRAFSSIISGIADDEAKLDNFFKNQFNESVHRAKENLVRIEMMKKLVHKIWVSCDERYREKDEKKDADKKMEKIFAGLRMSQFVRSKESRDG